MKRVLLVSAAFVGALVGAACQEGKEKPAVVASPAAKEISITSKSPEAVEVFKKGRDLLDNVRPAEAAEQFKRAIALDPDFALAHAFLGATTLGAEGLKHLEQAAASSAGLPEAERTQIEILLADRRGEEEKAGTLQGKLAALASGDWRAHFALGARLSGQRKWDDAIASLKKATALNPGAGTVYNTMGYTYLNMGKTDEAVEAFRKYASLKPEEPNPQDSLGEALMAAGRFDEAEAAFRKAMEIAPQFWNAHEGIAQARFLRGDWAGGREALAKARAGAPRPEDKLFMDEELALSLAAEGNTAAALKNIDGLEKAAEAEKQPFQHAFASIDRALVLHDLGKDQEAVKQTALAIEKAEKASLPGGQMNGVRRGALAIRVHAESKLGSQADVKKTLALIEEEAKKAPGNAGLQSMLHFAQGVEAAGHGDFKAAATHYAQCNDQDYYCRWQQVIAQEKAGDKAGAEASRQKLVNANRRDPFYLYVRSKVSAKEKAKSK